MGQKRPNCFPKTETIDRGTPIAGWLIRENPIKMDDIGIGVPLY